MFLSRSEFGGQAADRVAMSNQQPPARPAIAVTLGAATLVSVAVLLACDAFPGVFPARAHDFLAALPLTLIALAYVSYQAVRRVSPMEWLRTALVALAFLLWAANQLCTAHYLATLFNDLAIGAFVIDLFLIIVGWPPAKEGGVATCSRAATAPDPPTGAGSERLSGARSRSTRSSAEQLES
jgi:hypothetical protein